MVIAILFIGVFMVTSIAEFNFLVTVHEPWGIAILIFVLVRIGWRRTHVPPPFAPGMGPLDRLAATCSERLLYALLLCQPLIGWAMVSASGLPIVLFGSLHLPAIAPQNVTLFANLLRAHIVAAYLLYLTFAAHLAGVLMDTIVIRDKVPDRRRSGIRRNPPGWRQKGSDRCRALVTGVRAGCPGDSRTTVTIFGPMGMTRHGPEGHTSRRRHPRWEATRSRLMELERENGELASSTRRPGRHHRPGLPTVQQSFNLSYAGDDL
jgi:cytochrome b561